MIEEKGREDWGGEKMEKWEGESSCHFIRSVYSSV